jgi:hypothetical protein
MPADSFSDAYLNRSRPDVMSQEGLSPEWKLSLADRTGENPVRRLTETGSATPARRVRTKRGSRGTGFRDASVLHGPTDCLTMDRRTLSCFPAKSTSPHFRPNNSLMRSPVPAAKRTRVLSRSRKVGTSRLISEGRSTTGTVLRFALWRTRVMGLWSMNSCRLAWLKSTLIKFRILVRLARASGSVRSHSSNVDHPYSGEIGRSPPRHDPLP